MEAAERPDVRRPVGAAGLCGDCQHAEIVTSVRGSNFYLCRLSASDQRFSKYPALPVRSCEGYSQQPDPSGVEQLVPELRGYYRQFVAIEQDAKALLDGLSEEQLKWRETARTWSVADCLNHLVATGSQSLRHIRSAVAEARAAGLFAQGPLRHGVLGTWFVRLMDAPPPLKFKAPKAYRPVPDQSVVQIVDGFFLLQHDLFRALHDANGIDLVRVKVSNPVSTWFRLSLGHEFAFTAAHERRHLWQAARVRERLR
jgi:hypothetical protein